jgi:hypothetical protein
VGRWEGGKVGRRIRSSHCEAAAQPKQSGGFHIGLFNQFTEALASLWYERWTHRALQSKDS